MSFLVRPAAFNADPVTALVPLRWPVRGTVSRDRHSNAKPGKRRGRAPKMDDTTD